jgi:hypothetical protein
MVVFPLNQTTIGLEDGSAKLPSPKLTPNFNARDRPGPAHGYFIGVKPCLADRIAIWRGAVAFQQMRQSAARIMRGILRLVSKIENKSGLLRFERILPRITNDSLNHSVTLPDQKIRSQTKSAKKKAHIAASCNKFSCMSAPRRDQNQMKPRHHETDDHAAQGDIYQVKHFKPLLKIGHHLTDANSFTSQMWQE